MLPLVLALCLFCTLQERPLARFSKAGLVVVPALLASSLAVQVTTGLLPLEAKLAGFFCIGAPLAWMLRASDIFALALVLWIALDFTGVVLLGALPSWQQYVSDGNIFMFLVNGVLSGVGALSSTRHAARGRSRQVL